MTTIVATYLVIVAVLAVKAASNESRAMIIDGEYRETNSSIIGWQAVILRDGKLSG